MALIVPLYVLDPQTSQLVKIKDNDDLNRLVSNVSFQNGVCSIEDTDLEDLTISDTQPPISTLDSNNLFFGNVHDLTELFSALYENRPISHVSILSSAVISDYSIFWKLDFYRKGDV